MRKHAVRFESSRRAPLRWVARVVALLGVAVGSDSYSQQTVPATPAPYEHLVAEPRDEPYFGPLKVHVDASDTTHGIYRVTEVIPTKPGARTLLFPAWQPGGHSINVAAKELAGVRIAANGKSLSWHRSSVDAYEYDFEVPDGADSVTVQFEALSPQRHAQGSITSYPGVTWVEWIHMILYPAGFYTRQIQVDAEVVVPAGFQLESGLDTLSREGDVVRFARTNVDTLLDSPVLTAAHLRVEQLSSRVELDLMSESGETAVDPQLLAGLRKLPLQAREMFGTEHYQHYKFLAARNQGLGPASEHLTSSEQSYSAGFFSQPFSPAQADLYAHEYIHSWNGKFMRPNDLWTANYQMPMRGSMLWVYEGLTQLWGMTLAVRSGLMEKSDALDMLAWTAAILQSEPGRQWKSILDNCLDLSAPLRRESAWPSYQRGLDFYYEGALLWLEVDSILRERTRGRRSLDDFAKAFFGGEDADVREHTYDRNDLIQALQRLAPYDWQKFFHDRVDEIGPVPMAGITAGGYQLVYSDTPNSYLTDMASAFGKDTGLNFSMGMSVAPSGEVDEVLWDGPAFVAGVRTGSKIKKVNGRPFDKAALLHSVELTGNTGPITLELESFGKTLSVVIPWTSGLHHPHLVKVGKNEGALDDILRPLTATRR